MPPLNLDTLLPETSTWSPDQIAMLEDLQPNIVQAHVRDHSHYLFLRFTDAAKGQQFVRALAGKMKSARDHLKEVADHHDNPELVTSPMLGLFLSSSGYIALGRVDRRPAGPAFVGGMKLRQAVLKDPKEVEWDTAYQGEVHAMVMVAGDGDAVAKRATDRLADEVIRLLNDGVVLTGLPETGVGMPSLKAPGEGIEHFGYVDGRSQPLFLKATVDSEVKKNKKSIPPGTPLPGSWNPAFTLRRVLIQDKAGATDASHGSFFVYRKLEQNVRGFKSAENQLANALGMTGHDRERAGAGIVGRYEDGTPFTLQPVDGLNDPVPNDFDYGNDPKGLKCPFHAHIRKTNPRGDSQTFGLAPLGEEQKHIMARRGVTYGSRAVHPNDPGLDIDSMPEGGVGLLFMAYQSDIETQFEFTQQTWANNPSFVKGSTGIDPVIGQGGAGGQTHLRGWNDSAAGSIKFDFADFVKMRGGEYFFAPSLSALKAI